MSEPGYHDLVNININIILMCLFVILNNVSEHVKDYQSVKNVLVVMASGFDDNRITYIFS